jgi:hypothetical protein
MPDQVRHDGQNLCDFLNYDTVWFAGMTVRASFGLFSKPSKLKSKWFDKPFDRLTVLSEVEGLTTLSPVEGQISEFLKIIMESDVKRPASTR